MVIEWLDWFAGWETSSGLLVLDDSASLPAVLATEWGRRAHRIAVLPADGSGVVPLEDGGILRIRPYREVRLLPVDGWTIATLDHEADLAEFIGDAGRSRAEATLPPVLTDPRVQVADLDRLGWPWPAAGPPTRCRVTADGTVTWGLTAQVLGRIDEPVEQLSRRWHRSRPAVPDADLADFLSVMTGTRILRAHLSIHSSPQTLDPLLAVDQWPQVTRSGLLPVTLHGRTWTVDVRHRKVLAEVEPAGPAQGIVLSPV